MTRRRSAFAAVRIMVTAVLAVAVALSAAAGCARKASAPLPIASGLTLGFSAGELVGMAPAHLSTALDAYTAAGGTVIRFDISWARVQAAGPNSWDWSAIDPIMSALTARHLTALPILDYTPAWARPSGCPNELCEPADPAAFAAFASAAARRYAHRVGVWEIWNEQNVRWLPAPNPRAYGQLLRQTSASLHRVDPAATVLVGGLAPARTSKGGDYSPADFLAALYALGLRADFDGVAVHPYSFPSLPGELGKDSGWEQMLQARAVMVGHQDAAKAIWATEFGAPTAGPGALATSADRRYPARPDHVDLMLQAQTVELGVSAGRRLPWLRVLLWYGLRDLGADPKADLMSFGLRGFDGAPKPSYDAWRSAVRSLHG